MFKRVCTEAGIGDGWTTEVIYRREPRPVITTGAEIMDELYRSSPVVMPRG